LRCSLRFHFLGDESDPISPRLVHLPLSSLVRTPERRGGETRRGRWPGEAGRQLVPGGERHTGRGARGGASSRGLMGLAAANAALGRWRLDLAPPWASTAGRAFDRNGRPKRTRRIRPKPSLSLSRAHPLTPPRRRQALAAWRGRATRSRGRGVAARLGAVKSGARRHRLASLPPHDPCASRRIKK
jgi:hypothetical protein